MNRPPTETAHVLMTDYVGYSQLPIEQKAMADKRLLDAVLECPALEGLGDEECIRLDSGDGISLVFFADPVRAIEAAEHLYLKVAEQSVVKLRMGLHSGMVTRRQDVNGKTNVSGPGIEKAQRAMSCADGSRIVMTDYFAENLRALESWKDRLVELGEFEIKHGEKLRLFGLVESMPPEPNKVAIIYRQKAKPDDYVLELLERRLPEFGFTLFINRGVFGVDYARKIEPQIRTAEAVIVLLSERAALSEMVIYELQIARDQHDKTGKTGKAGKPVILPVRIGKDDPIEGELASLLPPNKHALWTGPEDDDRLVQSLMKTYREPPTPLERVGGAMPLDSPYYILRPTDHEFKQALLDRDSIVLVKGGRQIGKTSLVARALREATASGARVVWTDLQAFAKSQIETDERLYLALAHEFVSQLGLDDDPLDHWRDVLGPNTNFERFIQNRILKQIEEPIVWAIDEVDRLFTMPYSGDFFGMIRTWHNRRAARAEETWGRFTVALAYAKEAHLFISDLNQSPFNVGTRLELADFDLAQVSELNSRYNSPLGSAEEITRFQALLGGQPYLTRRGLDEMVRQGASLADLERDGAKDEGPFSDHLRRILVALSGDAKLLEEVRIFAHGGALKSDEDFFRLRAGGVVRGAHRTSAEFRCGIYGEYLRRHLEA